MAHIELNNFLPGIRGLMAYSPATANPLNELAEILLRDDDNTLSRGERELIGTYVSYLNDCFFCQHVHGAMAAFYLERNNEQITEYKRNFEGSDLSDKLKSLLSIAASVQQGGQKVQIEQIKKARSFGATDKEIHDTVLIAAAFCMFNRYVDGLGTWAPENLQFYSGRAAGRAEEGYRNCDVLK